LIETGSVAALAFVGSEIGMSSGISRLFADSAVGMSSGIQASELARSLWRLNCNRGLAGSWMIEV